MGAALCSILPLHIPRRMPQASLRQASGKPPDHSLEVGTLSDGLAQGRVLDEGVAPGLGLG